MERKVIKRDGRLVPFEPQRIERAIFKALEAVKEGNGEKARAVTKKVIDLIKKIPLNQPLAVEEIQDLVEAELTKSNLLKAAKAYILYRKEREELRETKKIFGVEDDLKLSLNALQVLARRYLLRDENGKIKETPKQMLKRVASAIARAEENFGQPFDKAYEDFFELLVNLDFLPNSPTLMNAGTELNQLSACFVVPIEDSLEGIFEAVKAMALIQKSGGGTGFSFSRLRPKGDMVRSTKGIASGPVSFMRVFDITTDVIRQGGKRRGANMGILRVDHPDIFEFITAKKEEGSFTNFNLSVAVTDEFMEAVKTDSTYFLVNPRNRRKVKEVKARSVFDLIVANAWKTGDPGLVFIDEVNRHNPTPLLGEIESTNPCGEQPLLPYESCNLGSINLARMVRDGKIDWQKLEKVVKKAVQFLDNVIEVNQFPLPQIAEMTLKNRKIGLGVMGLAEALILLGVPYDSQKALEVAQKIMKFILEKARETSVELGLKRGSFSAFKGSRWKSEGYQAMRNATCTTIAPTGTISIIAGTTSGIEPLFALVYVREVLEGSRLIEVNPIFDIWLRKQGWADRKILLKIAREGSLKNLSEFPAEWRRLFVTALDIEVDWHVKMQAAFQKYTDNAVSKTVNLPFDSTPEDVKRIFLLAYNLKCKGITVYRYGSRKEQVLKVGSLLPDEEGTLVLAGSEYSGGCPATFCPF